MLQRYSTTRVLSVIAIMGALAFVVFIAATKGWSDYSKESLDFIAKKYTTHWHLILIDTLTVLAVVIIVSVIQGWKKGPLRRLIVKPSKSAQIDWFMWILRSTYIVEIIVFLMTAGFAKDLRWHFRHVLHIEEEWLRLMDNILVQQIVFLFVFDLVFYWLHRLEHKIPAMWAFHKFHHSADEMNIITSKREHPVESDIFRIVFEALPFAVLGAPFVSYVIFRIIRSVLPSIQHSDLNWGWGWFGKWIIVSPRYHEIHHSKDEKHRDRNFAGYFPILDHMFGTYYNGKSGAIQYGVDDDNLNKTSFINSLWIPFVESGEAIRVALRLNKSTKTTKASAGSDHL